MNLQSILSALLLFAGFAQAQVAEKKSLTLDGARQVIAGAVAYRVQLINPGIRP